MQVMLERIGGFLAQVALDAADRQVHLGKLPGRCIGFLPKDADVIQFAAMRLNEFFRLHEHSA